MKGDTPKYLHPAGESNPSSLACEASALTTELPGRVYLPSCTFTGPGLYARVAPSPYLHLSNLTLKVCTLVADTTSSLKLFHVSIHLCGKLYFLTSLRHLPFLSFLLCDLVLRMSYSSLRISFSLSTWSIPLINLKTCIRSPLSLLVPGLVDP